MGDSAGHNCTPYSGSTDAGAKLLRNVGITGVRQGDDREIGIFADRDAAQLSLKTECLRALDSQPAEDAAAAARGSKAAPACRCHRA